MAEATLSAGLPGIDLQGGYQVVLEAIDPITGQAVPDVLVASVAIFGETTGESGSFSILNPVLVHKP